MGGRGRDEGDTAGMGDMAGIGGQGGMVGHGRDEGDTASLVCAGNHGERGWRGGHECRRVAPSPKSSALAAPRWHRQRQ